MKPRDLDPASSVLAYFGSELRRYRTAAGLTQERLGEVISYTGSLVGQVETARRPPTREFAERCDAALDTDGALGRLWPLVSRAGFPSWFRGFVELEASATGIRSFQSQVVHGLLQTPAYARAVLGAGLHDDLDDQVAARLDRQTILARPNPPHLWVILDESVLHRPIGGARVLHDQLAHLLRSADSRRVVIQVLPYRTGAHAGLNGSLTLLSLPEGTDVAYTESYGTSQLTTDQQSVRRCTLRYDLLRAAALSPDESAAAIASAMEAS